MSPEQFAVDVFSELPQETIQRRWSELNVLLRMSMLTALDMQLDATLNMICDLAGEIIRYDRGAVFLWEEEQQVMHTRVTRNIKEDEAFFTRANVLNYWTAKTQRPLLIKRGLHPESDAMLKGLQAASVLVIPLFVQNRVMGSLQFFADDAETFCAEDAQLLWVLALISENLLTRDFANEALLHFAFTDFLTGMKTRGYFEQQLELELKRAERAGSPLALLMVDIDYFKKLNDNFGHHVGDQVLRDMATILMKDMREIDTVARYGGEEFVIVLPNTGVREAMQVAQRLRRAVAQAKFFAGTPDNVQHLTISIGIAVFGQDAQFKRDLIENADAALYEAKGRGRDQVVLYSDLVHQRDAS
ncbi:MAG TPA: GGDEF domain-containing protein [Clostridia bacterium]|nr:GGDEF domain-containing protein [Clostridia bacterium]